MGNSGSSDVTIEKDGDNFFLTNDGVKLSPSLIERMSSDESTSKSDQQEMIDRAQSDVGDARRLLEECQKMIDIQETQLADLNNKWSERLDEEKQKHEEFYKNSLDVFQHSAEETEQKFRKPALKPICENLQKALVNCYLENQEQTLNCTQHLKDFRLCVNRAKDSLLCEEHKDGA